MSEKTMTPRNPGIVASDIKALVPVEQDAAIKELDKIISNASFRPPEIQNLTWDELSWWLHRHVSIPLTDDWKIKALSIFMVLTEEEVVAKFNN